MEKTCRQRKRKIKVQATRQNFHPCCNSSITSTATTFDYSVLTKPHISSQPQNKPGFPELWLRRQYYSFNCIKTNLIVNIFWHSVCKKKQLCHRSREYIFRGCSFISWYEEGAGGSQPIYHFLSRWGEGEVSQYITLYNKRRGCYHWIIPYIYCKYIEIYKVMWHKGIIVYKWISFGDIITSVLPLILCEK